MPKDSNFFLDLRDGTAYFRGKVYAEEGRFRGDVYADNFYFNDGDDVRTLINDAGEVDFSKMKRIDLGGIVLDGETGNINFTGAGSITWGDNTPVKYQFGTSSSGPWHSTMAANDKYRRDSLDGGTTWGEPYQFRGTDGYNGSDANVTWNNVLAALKTANGVKKTFITADGIGAPTIYGAKIYGAEIYAGGVNNEGGQIIGLTDKGITVYNGSGGSVLTIHEVDGDAYLTTGYNMLEVSCPTFYLEAPHMSFGSGIFKFFNTTVDFSDARQVIGLSATFA